MSQTELAEQMNLLGHQWTRATVSDVERSGRNLTVDEVLALAMALNVTIPDLLDPAGIDGRRPGGLDYGGPEPVAGEWTSDWIRGRLTLTMQNGSLNMEGGNEVLGAAKELGILAKDDGPVRKPAKRPTRPNKRSAR